MRSLRARLTVGVALVLAVVIAGFSVALYAASSRAASSTARTRLNGATDRLAASVEWAAGESEEEEASREGGGNRKERPARAGHFKTENDMLSGLLGNSKTAFRIEAPGGQVLKAWSPPGGPEGEWSVPPRPETDGAIHVGNRHWQTRVSTRPARIEEEAKGSPPGPVTIAVAVDVTEEREHLRLLATLLSILGPVVFLLGVGGVSAAVRRGLAPLCAMGEAAARIDERTLSERVPVPPTGDELARLGESLNAALARLEEAFGRERAFIADASHELRTPVSILLTTLEVSQSRPRTPEETAEAMETLLQTTRRLRGIVESMLTLARADAGRLPLQREPVDLASILRQSAAHLAPLAAPRNIALDVRADAPIPLAGDAGLLRQLFDNLIANAIRYNSEGGRVDVTGEAANEQVTVSVRDTGIGIPADHLPHLFERFYRVDTGRSRAEGGAGLGLSIARWIAESHGGSIGVESAPGKGTTFRVTLPAAATPSPSRDKQG